MADPWLVPAAGTAIAALNLVVAFINARWRLYWFAAMSAVMGIAILVIIGAASWNLVFGECAGAPPVVPFHQGMTLCPGQSAVGTITIEIPAAPAGRGI